MFWILASIENKYMFYVDNGVHVNGSRFLQVSAGNHGLCIGYFHFCLFVCFVVDVV